MVCDAIATARARVTAGQTLQALEPRQIQELITQFLKTQEGFEIASAGIWGNTITVYVKSPYFCVQFNVKTGEVLIRAYDTLAFDEQKLAEAVAGWVGQVAGAAYQEQVAKLLAKIGHVTSAQRTKGHHSALVVKMRI